MFKYLIEFKETKSSALVEYDENDLIISFELSKGDFTEHQIKFFNSHFPKKKEHLEWYKTNTKAKIKEIEPDLSFERFWNDYENKVGNKSRALKLWNSLPNPEKAKALKYIATYDTQLAITKVAKLYPETYLNQQRWNN